MEKTNSGDLQFIIDALPQMFFHKDTENNIIRANKAAADAVGTTVTALVGTPTTLWFPDEAGEYYKDDLAVMKSGVPRIGITEQFQVSGGEKHWISTDKFPHFDDANNVDGIFVFIRDTTAETLAENERLELEAQIRRSQKLEGIGVLAAGVAHDFNNHLMTIVGNAELALTRLDEPLDDGKLLENILQSAMQASEVCKQLLTYAGRAQFDQRPCSLFDIVADIKDLLESTIDENIEIIVNSTQSASATMVDPSHIKQLLINLVRNSAEAIANQSGQIVITTGERHYHEGNLPRTFLDNKLAPGLYCYISVKDTGSGMNDEVVDQMFQPFFTTKTSGRGLGLATVLGTVRSHGGGVTVTTEPAVGTTIELLLPVAQARAGEGEIKSIFSEVVKSGSTILVVDDDDSVRVLLQSMLERAGYAVITAINGVDAIEIFGNNCDDIKAVLLDFSMPGLNGIEVFASINQKRPGIPVLFSSGYPEEMAIDSLEFDGRVQFIKKPYRSPELLAKIGCLLA